MQGFERAIFIIGPTASGKTALAHTLADRLGAQDVVCELVNLDAFQFYRGVTAGTAKPTPEDVNKYRYHGIDILEPCESMDAARYADFVWSTCRDVCARGHVPICVGGSGLYLRAVLHGLDPLPPRNDDLRQLFRVAAAAWGWPELHRWLSVLAPKRASQLHPNDKTRIERALEIVFQLPDHSSIEDIFRKETALAQQAMVGDGFVIHVDCADEILKQRISARIGQMFAAQWLKEVNGLQIKYGAAFAQSQSGKAIGYPELLSWISAQPLENRTDPESLAAAELQCERELFQRLETLTWQYVRRQRTWNAKERLDWLADTTCWVSDQFQIPFELATFLGK